MHDIRILVGQTFDKVTAVNDEVTFYRNGDAIYRMMHIQDCCESVYLEDIDAPLDTLEGTEILEAEEVTNSDNPGSSVEDYVDSFTWTFYKFRTAKGWLTMRWFGESNGYYSESVDLVDA